jgi:O-antigen/teichoic acid export membrane protein
MRIGQTSLVVFLAKIFTTVFGFVATIFLARILGAEVLGYYAGILAVASWLRLVGQVGVARSVTKRISEGAEQSEFFVAGLLSVLTLGSVASLAAWLFRHRIDQYIGVEATAFVILLVMAGLYQALVLSALSGERRVHLSALLNASRVGLRSLVQIALVFGGFGLLGMIVGTAVAAVVAGTVGFVVLSATLARPHVRHFKSLFDFAKYAWLGGMRNRSFNNLDVLVLTAMVSPNLVGIYSIAWGIANVLKTFGAAIRKTVFPEISNADAEAESEYISGVITDAIAYGGLLIIPGLVGGYLVGERLLRLYGEEFQQGSVILVLLIVTVLVDEYHRQLLNALNALDRPDLAFRINSVFLLTNLLFNVVLVALFGWVGAAVATVISASVGLTLAYRASSALLPFEIPLDELSRQAVAALVMGGVVFGARELLETSGIAHNLAILLTLVALGAGVYFLVLVTISSRFRDVVAANLPSQISTFS